MLLYTRVTPSTWLRIQPFSREGDLFWGRDVDIPLAMRGLMVPTLAAFQERFDGSCAAVLWDCETDVVPSILPDGKAMRSAIRQYNQANGARIAFAAFYHLNSIDADPRILAMPNTVIVGKTPWQSSPAKLIESAGPYIDLILTYGKQPAVLLSNITKADRQEYRLSGEQVLALFRAAIDELGLNIINYYYDRDEDAELLVALQALRG